jgi:stress-induced-phosphoprotein 1
LEDNQQKIREELKKCEKLLKDQEAKNYVNPALGEAANERAKEFFLKGDFAGAMTEYNEAIMRNPNEARYYSNRGTCYIKLMSFHLAVKDFEKALELTPNSVKILIKKATCHHAMKEFHKAVDLYNQALKIEPENQECKDGLLKTQTSIYSGSEEE